MIKNILVSQPQPKEKSPYFELEKYGVNVTFRSLINVEKLTPQEFRKQRVSILDYTAIVFTSKHAIRCFFELCAEMRISMPDTMKYFATSEAIALYIQKYAQYRKRKVFFGTTGKIQDLIPQMVKHKTEKYLVPQSDVHTDEIKNLLDSKKLQHTECVMYRTVSNDFTEEEIKNFDYDMLIFFSPTGIQSLTKNFPEFKQGDIRIGTFGPSTAKAVEDMGLRLDLQAPSEKYPSMTSALKAYLQENKKK